MRNSFQNNGNQKRERELEAFLNHSHSTGKTSVSTDPGRKATWEIYDFIAEGLYLNRRDIRIKGKAYNTALLMSLITGLSRGKQLIIGEPGLGKTTSAEYACSLMYRLPLGAIWRAEISGHPEQTEEKIIGRPDLGKLNLGQEEVIWSYFTILPAKIVDELNRLPETKQSLILEGVDRGKWEYLNESVINREYCFFATANYEDRGTNTIIMPLIDRFDVMVESKHPGPNLAYRIGTKAPDGDGLRHIAIEEQIHQTMSEKLPYDDRLKRIEAISERFGTYLFKEFGLRTLSFEDRCHLYSQKSRIPFDLDANAFLRLVIAELSFCQRLGQKRSHEGCEEGCHFTGYLCNAVQNCISNRFSISVQRFSQTLAWLMGNDVVDLEHLKVILPFTLAHRIHWKEDMLAQCDQKIRNDPLMIYMAKKAVDDMHRRYTEQAPRIKDALAVAFRISEGEDLEPVEGDHPIYWEIRKDLGKETIEK